MKLKEILTKVKINNQLFEEDYLDEELDEKLEMETDTKPKGFLGKFNKKIVSLMIACVVLISALITAYAVKSNMALAKEKEEMVTTIQVTKQDIQKTLSATGTIIASEESGQFATTTGSYPVEEVYVKVGDVVKKGDPLYKLDMSTMEETLSYQQEALDLQNQQNAIAKENADKALQDAKDTGATQINESNRNLSQAQQEQTSANRNKSNANSSLESAKNSESSAKTDLDNTGSALNDAQNKVNELNNKISDLQSQIDNPGTHTETVVTGEGEEATETTQEVSNDTTELQNQLSQAKNDLEAAQKTVVELQESFNSKRETYQTAVSNRTSAEQSVQSANDAVNSANRSVESAQASVNSTTNSANSNIISQSQAVRTNELSAASSTLSAEQEISKSKDELNKATVYASMDGTVTNVNIVAGQTYSGTDAIVIDNIESLKATADIDEASIATIALGQKVLIKTDSTGDTVLNGTVSFVSPTATKNSTKSTDGTSTTASVSKSRATYRVDVTLDENNENLRLGMTAKMTFITASVKDAIVVPSSDIQTDEEGNKYVVVQKSDNTTENVTVETGISDDFYTEIKGTTLTENDTIVESQSDGSVDSVLDDMGADGGIYFE